MIHCWIYFASPNYFSLPIKSAWGIYSEWINLQSLDTVLRENFGLCSSFSFNPLLPDSAFSFITYILHSAHFSIAVILFALPTPQSFPHMHLLINLFFTLTHLAQPTNIYPCAPTCWSEECPCPWFSDSPCSSSQHLPVCAVMLVWMMSLSLILWPALSIPSLARVHQSVALMYPPRVTDPLNTYRCAPTSWSEQCPCPWLSDSPCRSRQHFPFASHVILLLAVSIPSTLARLHLALFRC